MDGFIQISLKDMIDQVGEERVKSILSTFSCPMNKDVEQFLSHTAIEFAKQRIASTHLVFTSYKKELVLIGYYSLATKVINITRAGNPQGSPALFFCLFPYPISAVFA